MRILRSTLILVLFASIALGQTYLINETFVTVPPTGWTEGAVAPTQSSIGYDDSYALLFTSSASDISIVTSAVTDPDRISFYNHVEGGFSGSFQVNYGTTATGPWSNILSFTPSATTYTVSATELSLSAGTYYFQFVRIGDSKARKNMYVDLVQVTQSIVVSTGTLSGFSYEPSNGPSAEQSFTVSGVDLTANIVITPPTNYEISTTSGSGFGSSVTLTQSGGVVNTTTIYVRLKSGLAEGAYNGETISITSTGKINKTVSCSGDVRTSIFCSTDTLLSFNYDTGSGPSTEQSFTVFAQDLTADVSVVAPTDFEVSLTSGSGFGSSVTLTQSGGIVDTASVYVRMKAGLSQGSYDAESISISSSGKVSHAVVCNGFVGPLILNIKIFIEGSLW